MNSTSLIVGIHIGNRSTGPEFTSASNLNLAFETKMFKSPSSKTLHCSERCICARFRSSMRFCECLVEDPGQTIRPGGGLIVEACLYEFCSQRRILGELPDVEFVPGVAGQLGEEHRLCASVALTETVDRVDLAPVISEAGDELRSIPASQQVIGRKLTELLFRSFTDLISDPWVIAVLHRGRCRVAGREVDDVGAAFGHLPIRADPFLTCPFVYVLEQCTVNSLEVRVVEVPLDRFSVEFDRPQKRCSLFVPAQFFRVPCPVRVGSGDQLVS